VTTIGQRRSGTSRQRLLWLLCICDAALLVASGLFHLHLWDIAYRNVPTLRYLFLVQVAATLLFAVALLVLRRLIVVLASLALMVGTIAGFIMARTVGIFGFKDPSSTTLAIEVLVVELAAIVALATTAWLIRGRTRPVLAMPGRSSADRPFRQIGLPSRAEGGTSLGQQLVDLPCDRVLDLVG
jgi:hypothetical protein